MLNVPSFQNQGRPAVGPVPRDPKTQVFVRIALRALDLSQKLLGSLDLFEPPFPRRIPSLLLFQLLHRGMAVRFPYDPSEAHRAIEVPDLRSHRSVFLAINPPDDLDGFTRICKSCAHSSTPIHPINLKLVESKRPTIDSLLQKRRVPKIGTP